MAKTQKVEFKPLKERKYVLVTQFPEKVGPEIIDIAMEELRKDMELFIPPEHRDNVRMTIGWLYLNPQKQERLYKKAFKKLKNQLQKIRKVL